MIFQKITNKIRVISRKCSSSAPTSSMDWSSTILAKRAPTKASPAPVVSTALTWKASTDPWKFWFMHSGEKHISISKLTKHVRKKLKAVFFQPKKIKKLKNFLPWCSIWNHVHQEWQGVTSSWGATMTWQQHHRSCHFRWGTPAQHHWPWSNQPSPKCSGFAYGLPQLKATRVAWGLDHTRGGTQPPWQLPLPSGVPICMAPRSSLSNHNGKLLPAQVMFHFVTTHHLIVNKW